MNYILMIDKTTRDIVGFSTAMSFGVLAASYNEPLLLDAEILDDSGNVTGTTKVPISHFGMTDTLYKLVPWETTNRDLVWITTDKNAIINTMIPESIIKTQTATIQVSSDGRTEDYECFIGVEFKKFYRGIKKENHEPEDPQFRMIPRFANDEQKSRIIEITEEFITNLFDETEEIPEDKNAINFQYNVIGKISNKYRVTETHQLVAKE